MSSPEDSTQICDRVVLRIADRFERDPLEMEPLGAAVDPRLLREFAASDAVLPESELHFYYCGCEVCVSGAGDIDVEPAD